jgi:hypothetical protein
MLKKIIYTFGISIASSLPRLAYAQDEIGFDLSGIGSSRMRDTSSLVLLDWVMMLISISVVIAGVFLIVNIGRLFFAKKIAFRQKNQKTNLAFATCVGGIIHCVHY